MAEEQNLQIYSHYGGDDVGTVIEEVNSNIENEDIKTPKDFPISEDYSLTPPINYTDPFVYHDGVSLGDTIIKPLDEQKPIDYADNGNFGSEFAYDNIKVDGIYQPIIKYNNTILDPRGILRMELDYSGFYPKLDLYINTRIETNLEFNDTPGMNNRITVIIIPAIDGAYKKISLNFTIYNHERHGNIIYVNAEVRILALEQNKDKHIVYTDCPPGSTSSGCPNVRGKIGSNGEKIEGTISCNYEHSSKPNTWEYLHEIALQCGLGFASTDECQNVQDRLPRLVQNISYYYFIQKQIQFSGIDEYSIFDVWLDLYGCITMVNIPYILSSDITSKNLSFKVFTGIWPTSSNAPDLKIKEVHRTLSNYKQMPVTSNAEIKSYRPIVDNSNINRLGNLFTLHSFTPEGVQSGDNTISTSQAIAIENSPDGYHSEDYTKDRCVGTSVEVNEYNINQQKMHRKLFFNKLNSKLLEVELSYPNLGIQRGTLINISIFTDDPIQRSQIMASADNAASNTTSKENSREIILDQNTPVLDTFISGLYYVHKMKFVYDSSSGYAGTGIKQYLYLFKKDSMENPQNKYTSPNVNVEALGNQNEISDTTPTEAETFDHY